MVNEIEQKNLRVRMNPELKDQIERMLEKKKVSWQDAIDGLMRFVLSQGDVAQSVILGQVEPTPEVLRAVYAQMGASDQAPTGPTPREGSDSTSASMPPQQPRQARPPVAHRKGR